VLFFHFLFIQLYGLNCDEEEERMSVNSYHKALKIMDHHKDMCHFVGPRNEELIKLAEETLGFRFSPLYRDFVKKFGAGNFGSKEIYGVIDEDFENSSVPDAVWFTLTEREETNLPKNLLVIYDTDGDELYCLDFNQINTFNEPAVVSFILGQELHAQNYEIIAEDLGDFLFNLVSQEI
jgi:antitoxin YobK